MAASSPENIAFKLRLQPVFNTYIHTVRSFLCGCFQCSCVSKFFLLSFVCSEITFSENNSFYNMFLLFLELGNENNRHN
jgi:hypothetical protein